MDVFTTQPGVHLYTGNLLNGVKGKEGAVYHQHGGFALETQHYPDSPNRPDEVLNDLRTLDQRL